MLNIPNTLSFIRLLLAIPICYFLYQEQYFLTVLFALLAILTDNLDGYFARKYNQITELGKIIDPIADKTIICTVAIIFFLKATDRKSVV